MVVWLGEDPAFFRLNSMINHPSITPASTMTPITTNQNHGVIVLVVTVKLPFSPATSTA
jgi:hypothetical protein